MTDALPPPLVPEEVDLRGFETMPLAVQMLRDSRFAAEVEPEAFRSGVLLWCASWHQVPAGSLPDNDVELAKLAGYGFVVKEWRKVKAQAMTKFILCSDGRWYHEEISQRARSAWQSRLEHFFERAKERLRKTNKQRADKQLPPLPELTFEAWNANRIAGGIPMEKAAAAPELPPETPPNSAEPSAETPPPSAGIPPETELIGRGRGRGNGELRNTKDINPDGLIPELPSGPPAADRPQLSLVEPAPDQKPWAPPPCPHAEVLALWAEVLPHMPQHLASQWRGTREAHLRSRWRETAEAKRWPSQQAGLDYLRKLFAYVGRSPFLTGREASQGRKPFVIELAWLLEPLNWAKVHEGKYHDMPASAPATKETA